MGLREIFKPKAKEYEYSVTGINYSDIASIFYNDAITIVDKCCRCCTNSKPATSTENAAIYISKRIKIHHESILEHSNLIIKVRIDSIGAPEYFALISNLQYVRVVHDQTFMYFAASIRGWKEFFKHSDREHPFIMQLYTEFSTITPRCLVLDLIEDGTFGEYDFPEYVPDPDYNPDITDDAWHNIESGSIYDYTYPVDSADPDAEQNIEIVNLDNLGKSVIDFEWYDASGDAPEVGKFISEINPFDFLKLGTVTVCFKNMSRAATHQLVRHRNGITQESQRYVNYSDAKYFVPDTESDLFNSHYQTCVNAYNKAIEQGVKKEDARYLLPNGVECGQLYMTFTWYSLAKFLQLRMDKAAQAEIRGYAVLLFESIKDVMDDILKPWNIKFKYVIEHIDDWHTLPVEDLGFINYDEVCDEPADTDDEVGTIER